MMTRVAATTDLSKMPTRQLLALWAQALRELRDRDVVRTFNNPVGDIAEALVALHYEGERGSFSQGYVGREDSRGRAAPGQGPSPDGDEDAPQPLAGALGRL
jgi:hypothetical protein